MEVMDKALLQITVTTTTKVVVVEVDMDRVEGKTPIPLRILNANYVVNFATQFRSVTIDLISPFKVLTLLEKSLFSIGEKCNQTLRQRFIKHCMIHCDQKSSSVYRIF